MNKKEKLSIKEINKQQFSSEEGKAIEELFREWFQLQPKAKNPNEKYSIVTIDAAINLLKSGLSKLNAPGYEFINCFNITEVSRFQFLYDDCFNEAEAYDKKNGFADFRNGLNFYLKFLNEKTYSIHNHPAAVAASTEGCGSGPETHHYGCGMGLCLIVSLRQTRQLLL